MLSTLSNFIAVAAARLTPFLTVAAAGGGHGEEGGKPHLPNFFSLLHDWGLLPDSIYHFTSEWINVIYGAFTAIIMSIFAMRVYARRKMIPEKAQNFLEMLVESMYNFIYSILGEDAKKYTPFLGTLFFYILINNFWGIIPGGHSPSTSINITASLAIIVFLYAQYTGIRRLGIVGYLDHLAGQPRSAISWVLVIILFPIHVIGEFAKPFSLAVRLFGNITGEDTLVAAFVMLGIASLAFIHLPVGLPLQVPFMLLGLLLSTIQALVFTILSTIYILLMLPHEEHAG
ncbi:MAG: F0F1 ATP synthase subunit A [Candidatus Zixiibacteriota bacterium]|nr:MAG: F0F1 ATP synthase subunit A [candidate division Zixibacteria bacterium]